MAALLVGLGLLYHKVANVCCSRRTARLVNRRLSTVVSRSRKRFPRSFSPSSPSSSTESFASSTNLNASFPWQAGRQGVHFFRGSRSQRSRFLLLSMETRDQSWSAVVPGPLQVSDGSCCFPCLCRLSVLTEKKQQSSSSSFLEFVRISREPVWNLRSCDSLHVFGIRWRCVCLKYARNRSLGSRRRSMINTRPSQQRNRASAAMRSLFERQLPGITRVLSKHLHTAAAATRAAPRLSSCSG